ncbi:MAG: rRNA pseudouridine synthase [Candidatus Nomurabacteria bacterium]|nr:rRNA pseudouridine synthase [Candidatus Nomurabacteria bacterium]
MRLNRFLAESTGLSRREADEKITAGQVLVNGKKAVLGQQIEPEADNILLGGEPVESVVKFTTVMLNKPAGYVSSRNGQGRSTVYELLPEKYAELKTVGRLDQDSSGLLLLSNDGGFTHQMTHPKFAKVKVYEVKLDKPLEPLHQQMIADLGIELADGHSKLGLEKLDDSRKFWRATMHEGRNRQIRRTFKALGYAVEALHRTHFGPYILGDLESGAFHEV